MNKTFDIEKWTVEKESGNVTITVDIDGVENNLFYEMSEMTDFWKSCSKNVGFRLDNSEYRVSLFSYLITTFDCDEDEVLQFLEFQFNNKA